MFDDYNMFVYFINKQYCIEIKNEDNIVFKIKFNSLNNVYKLTLDSKYYSSATATGVAVTTNASPTVIYEKYRDTYYTSCIVPLIYISTLT